MPFKAVVCLGEVQKGNAARLSGRLQVILPWVGKDVISNPSSRKGRLLSLVYHRAEARAASVRQSPGKQIALMNADTKLLTKILADRWLIYLSPVFNGTQTAFLSKRIEDNILAHLEEVE